MESNTFKSVTFGGFDKQDVISYIEKASKEHADALNALQQERDALQNEKQTLEEQLTHAKQQLASLNEDTAALRAELSQAQTETDSLKSLPAEVERLSSEIRALEPDAEKYREFRTRIGDIECEARKRAADLENDTNARLTRLAADFRVKYQDLVTAFDSTSAYVTGELRKVEVNLTQLPRALDQIGAELSELESTLNKQKPE